MLKRILFVSLFLLTVWLAAEANRYRQTLDVTGATTPQIKNRQGQPARLWWWKPAIGPAARIGSEEMGFGYSVWNSQWMVGRWLLVAEIGDSPSEPGGVDVLLLSPDPGTHHSNDYVYRAPRKELTPKRPWWPLGHEGGVVDEEF
jgi:hypothetical protein